jgi:hypothetical protein
MNRVMCAEAPANELDCLWHVMVAAVLCDRPVPLVRWCLPADSSESAYVDRWGELHLDFACYDVGAGVLWLRSDHADDFDLDAALYLLSRANGGPS